MGLALQTAARRDLVDVAVNVDLQQRARMIGWTSGRFWNHTVKAQRPELQLIDKHVEHPHRPVLSTRQELHQGLNPAADGAGRGRHRALYGSAGQVCPPE